MLVANTFDLWQKDVFFSAAEEVQQSADIMESSYRTWLKAKREGLTPRHLGELGRELQMALGTAKWQLEEFERAVRLSYQKNSDKNMIIRHKQFVSAIEDQISRIETAFRESLFVEGKKQFRWVDLDEEDCHDLALFLSGTPGTSKRIEGENINQNAVETNSSNKCGVEESCSLESKSISEMPMANLGKDSEQLLTKLREGEISAVTDEINHQDNQVSGNKNSWSLAGGSAHEIVIDINDDRQNDVLTESTPKEKGSKHVFRSLRESYHGGKGMQRHTRMKIINWINQHLRGDYRSRRQQQVSPALLISSKRYILALMLIIFLAVPFLLYST
ncbi:uncharacterized protein LOC127259569 [Andrographis paniculata]|uniref:uncharacterized protein LOC127259569 n=1 Tax=Andrographis paniculata TaxID=175694 RepID=UPI0021E786FD|nr:uncharacterized protein LOC127259569 [Andrographis paniculata]